MCVDISGSTPPLTKNSVYILHIAGYNNYYIIIGLHLMIWSQSRREFHCSRFGSGLLTLDQGRNQKRAGAQPGFF